MDKIWFTSDLHLLHPDIVKYCKRPTTVEEHDEWLIARINSMVSEKDTIYILGDVSMSNRANTEAIISKINGKKHLILGNHDKNLKNSTVFESRSHIKNVTFKLDSKEIKIILCHYPIASWEDKVKGSYHLHGHTHGRYKNSGRTIDIGVDNNDYYPVELSNIINLIDSQNAKKKL